MISLVSESEPETSGTCQSIQVQSLDWTEWSNFQDENTNLELVKSWLQIW